MKGYIFLALIALCGAKLFNEEDYQQIRYGPRPEQEDNAVSTIKCRMGYTVTRCECDRPEACKGTNVRIDAKTGISYCDAYNRPNLRDQKIPAVLAKVTCGKLLVRMESGYMGFDGGANPPTAKCPPHYQLMSCSMMSTYITNENPEPFAKRVDSTCVIQNACKKCRVQAHCIRITDIYTHI